MESLLKQFGLSEQEIVVFKILLKLGGAKVSDIAKQAGTKRTSCQEYIRSLEEKGLINYSKIGNKYFYQVEDPDKFRQVISERQFVVDKLIQGLREQSAEEEWQVRAVDVDEVQKIIKRAQKKEQEVINFGDKKVGGALVNKQKVLLYSTDQEMPGLEIKFQSIEKLHKDLLKIK